MHSFIAALNHKRLVFAIWDSRTRIDTTCRSFKIVVLLWAPPSSVYLSRHYLTRVTHVMHVKDAGPFSLLLGTCTELCVGCPVVVT